MQTLGVSDSTPRTESRIKSLFWPSVENAADMDYLGRQGCWIGLIAAVVVVAVTLIGCFAHTLVQTVLLVLLAFTYLLCAFGIREHDRFAAIVLFAILLVNTVIQPGVLGIILTAVLLSNVRAVWIAKRWQVGSENAELPPRFNSTFFDVLVDQIPQKSWPVLRWICYPLSALMLVMAFASVISVLVQRAR